MNQRYAIGAVLAAVLLAFGFAAVLYAGVGPAPDGNADDSIEEPPTVTPTSDGSDDGSSETPASGDRAPFSFTVEDVEECGLTCRDVTATLHNERNETASDVTVFTRIFAGEDSTEPADLVWEGSETVGTMERSSSHTTTERIELSLWDAREIDRRGGWITIVTTVRTDAETVMFQRSERVA